MQTVTTIDSALYLAAAFTGDSFAADWPVKAISQAYYPGRLAPIEWTGVCFGVNAADPLAPISRKDIRTVAKVGRDDQSEVSATHPKTQRRRTVPVQLNVLKRRGPAQIKVLNCFR
jgi:hypothetical protein